MYYKVLANAENIADRTNGLKIGHRLISASFIKSGYIYIRPATQLV